MKKLKAAIIGGGVNSNVGKAHYAAIGIDNKFSITCGNFSRKKNINLKTGQKLNLDKSKVYFSVDTLLANESKNIDIVIILTPPNTHLNIIKKIVRYKLPIICEKPLCSSINQVKKLEKLLGKIKFYMTFNYSGYLMLREMQKIIKRKSIGIIKNVHMQMPQDVFEVSKKKDLATWRLKDNFIPNLSLDLGSHLYNLYTTITGMKIKEVMALSSKSQKYKVAEDIKIFFKGSNKSDGFFWYSKSALGSKNDLKINIFGSKKSLYWKHTDSDILKINDLRGETKIINKGSKTVTSKYEDYTRFKVGHPEGFIESLANIYLDIEKNLNKTNNKNINVFDFKHSAECIRFLYAVSKSIKQKKWIKV